MKHRGKPEHAHPGEHPRRWRTTDRAPRRRAREIFTLCRCRLTSPSSAAIRCRRVDRANVALRLPFLLLLLLLLRRVLHHCVSLLATINQDFPF